MKFQYIKVCGLRKKDNIVDIISTGISHIGFIFYKKSPRYAVGKLDPQFAKSINTVKKVGVFVNASPSDIVDKIESYGLDMIQLHGSESPQFCDDLKKQISVMKAFNIKSENDIQKANDYHGSCDYFLFDAAGKSAGGNGVLFNWNLLDNYRGETPFFLSGGIGLEELGQIQRFTHSQCVGVDVNSKFESEPGIKKTQEIKKFMEGLKASNKTTIS